MRLISAAVLFCLSLATSQARDLSPNLVNDVARAYGFMVGQNLALDRIEREFPQLQQEVRLTRARFSTKFGNIEAALGSTLQSFAKDKFSAMDVELRSKIAENTRGQLTRLADAQAILKTVHERLDGKIPDEYLKPMLIVKYQGNQEREFADGWRQVFTTSGEGKARGMKIHIELPKSFGSKESPRPHIVRNWTSENGTGLQTIMLDVREVGETVRDEDVDDALAKEVGADVAGSAGELIESGRFRHETYPGVWFNLIREEERATIKIKLGMLYFMIFAGDKAVSVGCTSGSDVRSNVDPKKAISDLKPLCLQVLNTLVLPGAYR
jgi:hypothetical protein